MGVALSKKSIDFEIIIKTGDVKGAGTDSNVYCVLIDENEGKSRDLLLDVRWRNDFEKGSVDLFKIRNVPNLGKIRSIQLWRDKKGIGDDWFVETIKIKQFAVKSNFEKSEKEKTLNDCICNEDEEQNIVNNNNIESEEKTIEKNKKIINNINSGLNPILVFPCNRWIEPNRKYLLLQYDSVLPQFDPRKIQRSWELDEKKTKYMFADSISGIPKGVRLSYFLFA